MPFTLPEALSKLGTKFSGAGDAVSVDDVCSPLDKVRRAAVVGNLDVISSKPSPLLTDSLIPNDLSLYDSDNDNALSEGNKNLHKMKGLVVVGGCMMQTARNKFPVTVLYTDKQDAILIHATGVPFAALEAEFYDSAFDDTSAVWENAMLEDDKKEFSQWRKDGAHGMRNLGLANTPKFLLGNKSYTMIRHGVTQFLSLRSPEDASEYRQVKNRLMSDLCALPAGSISTIDMKKKRRVITAFHARSDTDMTVPKEVSVPPSEEREVSADKLMNSAIITWTAALLLKNAEDHAHDAQSQRIAEFRTYIPEHKEHERVMRDMSSEEAAFLTSARTSSVNKLTAFDDSGYTLPSVMNHLARAYTTKCITEINQAQANTGKSVMEAVAFAVFDTDDAKYVAEHCSAMCNPHMTVHSSMTVLGKCVVDHQAILVVTRDPDGRITNAKLVGHDLVIADVNKDAMTRCILYPWVTVVIIDKDRVSLLMTRDPEAVASKADFKREPLKLRNSAKSIQPSTGDNSVLRTKFEELQTQVSALKNANESALESIKEFERKMNFLVEKKADAADDAPDSSVAFNMNIIHTPSFFESKFKRTVEKLIDFEKKQRVV